MRSIAALNCLMGVRFKSVLVLFGAGSQVYYTILFRQKNQGTREYESQEEGLRTLKLVLSRVTGTLSK